MALTLDYCVRNPDALVKVYVFDVYWRDGGFGKHGAGPFATHDKAQRCIDAVGWAGEVRRVQVVCAARVAYRIFRGGALPEGCAVARQSEFFPEGR